LKQKDFLKKSASFPDDLKNDVTTVKKYKLSYEKICFSGKCIEYIRPINFDAILEDYIEKYNDADYIPYWAEFWPSGAIMAKKIWEKYNFKNTSVLELGSGTGIAGLSIPLKNGEIIYSDYDSNSFPFIKINHYLNYRNIPKILKLDWTKNDIDKKFKWILASDLAYEKRLFLPLIETMERLLAPDGKIILTEPERNFAKPFFALLKERGFNFNKILLDAENNNKDITIGFYEIFKNV
ncbi:MAG: hypothetical protein KAR38_14185, partial [Calditrichia bacterium]|nr:hypothetical protein [Calditrichia bacterium]